MGLHLTWPASLIVRLTDWYPEPGRQAVALRDPIFELNA